MDEAQTARPASPAPARITPQNEHDHAAVLARLRWAEQSSALFADIAKSLGETLAHVHKILTGRESDGEDETVIRAALRAVGRDYDEWARTEGHE